MLTIEIVCGATIESPDVTGSTYCALQHQAIFIWRGRNLEVFKSHATGLAQFKVLTGIFWAVGIFLLFIAGKIATIIAS